MITEGIGLLKNYSLAEERLNKIINFFSNKDFKQELDIFKNIRREIFFRGDKEYFILDELYIEILYSDEYVMFQKREIDFFRSKMIKISKYLNENIPEVRDHEMQRLYNCFLEKSQKLEEFIYHYVIPVDHDSEMYEIKDYENFKKNGVEIIKNYITSYKDIYDVIYKIYENLDKKKTP